MTTESDGPPDGSRLSGLNAWRPGTYLLYVRGVEWFRPGREPPWLEGELARSGLRVGPLPAYTDDATGEVVPALRVPGDGDRTDAPGGRGR